MNINSKLFLFVLAPFSIIWGWEMFTSDLAKFSVLSPETLTESVQKVETEVGLLNYYTYDCKIEKGKKFGSIYNVSLIEYPKDSFNSDSLEIVKDLMDSTVETSLASIQGELLYQSDEELQGFPCRLYKITVKTENNLDLAFKTKLCVVQNRVYSVQVITDREVSTDPNVDRFISSFRLTP